MTAENITISAEPREIDFWGSARTLWAPVIDGDGHHIELGLVGSARDALYAADAFRATVAHRGWTVAIDLDRRANTPSSGGGYREAC